MRSGDWPCGALLLRGLTGPALLVRRGRTRGNVQKVAGSEGRKDVPRAPPARTVFPQACQGERRLREIRRAHSAAGRGNAPEHVTHKGEKTPARRAPYDRVPRGQPVTMSGPTR
ncbi:hypothetical protein GCM10017687_16890 [Streptomyces echinatus]